jgi:hypothetical protein
VAVVPLMPVTPAGWTSKAGAWLWRRYLTRAVRACEMKRADGWSAAAEWAARAGAGVVAIVELAATISVPTTAATVPRNDENARHAHDVPPHFHKL